jgi:hypothetical protein
LQRQEKDQIAETGDAGRLVITDCAFVEASCIVVYGMYSIAISTITVLRIRKQFQTSIESGVGHGPFHWTPWGLGFAQGKCYNIR